MTEPTPFYELNWRRKKRQARQFRVAYARLKATLGHEEAVLALLDGNAPAPWVARAGTEGDDVFDWLDYWLFESDEGGDEWQVFRDMCHPCASDYLMRVTGRKKAQIAAMEHYLREPRVSQEDVARNWPRYCR